MGQGTGGTPRTPRGPQAQAGTDSGVFGRGPPLSQAIGTLSRGPRHPHGVAPTNSVAGPVQELVLLGLEGWTGDPGDSTPRQERPEASAPPTRPSPASRGPR